MSKKRFTLTVIVVLMILAFTITTVGAQGEPQAGTGVEPPDPSQFTPLPDNYTPDGVIRVTNMAEPISPDLQAVYTRLPKFYFTKRTNAVEYKVEVRYNGGSTIYTYPGAGVCDTYFCYLQPTTKLTNAGAVTDGLYEWRVSSRVGFSWSAPSSWALFAVYSKGFNSTFDTNYNNWNIWWGPWNWSNGRMWTTGDTNKYNSMYFTNWFNKFEYTVRMKRKGNEGNTNSLVLWGKPSPGNASHIWDNGIYFNYRNNGEISIWKMTGGGMSTQIWSDTPAGVVVPYGWNELRIVAVYPYVDFWLNGTYLGFIDTSATSCYIGFDAFTTGNVDEKFMVDWAKATAIQFAPFTEHDPAMRLDLNPIEGVKQ